VHPVDVPVTSALKVFTRWGAGAGECLGDAAGEHFANYEASRLALPDYRRLSRRHR